MEDDEWDFSAEELDALERDAIQKIALQRQQMCGLSSSSSSYVSQNPPRHSKPSNPPRNSNPSAASSSYRGKYSSSESKLPLNSAASGVHPGESCTGLPKLSVRFLLHASGCIAVKFPYNTVLVEALRRVPKASWNAKERLWMFPIASLLSAEKAVREVSGFTVEVECLDPLVRRAITAASAVPDLHDWYGRMPDNIESKLLPFQRDGVRQVFFQPFALRFVLQHGGRALLADEMGLGKTLQLAYSEKEELPVNCFQAIAVAACVRDSWPVLILSPSSLRLHWASVVLSQWSGSNRGGFSLVSSAKDTINLDGLFNIISYDIVPKLQNMLMASKFKASVILIVIADESHFLKNAQAKRTTASLPVIKNAKYAILLSGTPALSRPIELFKQLEALYPDVYKSVHEYGNRYCKGGLFGAYQGASNHEELHNLMKTTMMIRRLKKDVLSELPQKRRQQVFLELAEKDMKNINALFRELEVIKTKIKACTSEEEVTSLKFVQKNLISKIYTDSAEAKVPAVLDYLATVVEAGCKFLVFAHHRQMIDSVHDFLLKKKVGCIRIDGGTPSSDRQALVTDFQENDAIKAAVLSIKAGGVGLTLTAASTVIFAELAWTPGDLIQAEDRVHRIGQVSSVNIYYLLANDTVDDIIWDVVQSKLENLGQMLNGHEDTLEVSKDENQLMVEASNGYSTKPLRKQETLDCFVKRCKRTTGEEEEQCKLKFPRH
ncbi:SWI/SNF-related matrix-associated actin-dependent regulator of chromatin subfamily A-like protein 1 [Linum grandiflorum]